MKFRRDIGITRQIATIPFIAFAGFVAVLALVYHYSGSIADGSATIAREMDDVQNIRQIEAIISEMRQAEKQYFLSADNVSLGEVFDQNDRLLAAVEKIRLEYPQADGVLRAIAWQDSLTRYRSLFEKMSNNRMTVGANETTGLRATMRAAIHIVEREIDRIGQSEGVLFADASESLHQLRRHEKDYFLRGREIYLVSWKVEHTKLESWLLLATDPTRKVMLVEALSRYSTAFRKIVKLRRDIARQSREIDAISQELNLSLHRASKAEIRSVTQTSEANIHAVRTGFLKLALATALIALFSLVSARLISNGITLPLLAMTRTIKGLAAGKMNMIIPALEYGNEIGELARSAEIFRAHESQRHEDHALLEQEKEHTDRLIRSMTGALLEVDSNGTILLTNPAAEALLHAKPGELIGRQMAEFLPGDVEVPKNYGCLKLIQSGLSQMHSSGAKSVHDAMADSGLPMFLIDETGAIVQANALAAEATGYCHDRLPGMPINELLPKQDRANHDRMIRAFFEETEPRSLAGGKPLAARTASGSRINIGIDLIPLALDGRKAVLMITRREGIDPAFADLSPNVLTLQFSGVDLDPRVLRMLPGREDQLLNDHALSTLDGAHVDVNVAGDLLRRDDGTVSGAIFVINDISERLERDRELQRLNSALDRSASKIYMIDPETLKFTYYNQVALKRIEPLHADPADLTPMDIDPRVTEPAFRKMLQPLFDRTKKTVLYETVQQNEDGTVTPEEVRFQFIRPAHGKPQIVAFVNNIVERKKQEREIRKFKDTLDATSDAVFMFRPDTLEFIYLNETARTLTGFSEQNYRDKRPNDIIPVFEERRFRKLVEPLVNGTERSVKLETTGLNFRPAELTLELFDEDAASDARFVLTCRDISERKRAEREISLFKRSLDVSQDSVYMFDAETLRYTYMNETARKKSGWSEREYLTKTLKDFNSMFDRESFIRRAKPLLSGEKPSISYEMIGKGDIPVEVTLQLLESSRQRRRFIAFVRDITERKMSEREIRQFKRSLDASQDSVYMFLTDSLRYTYMNETARKKSGWSEREYLAKTPADLNWRFDREKFLRLAEPLTSGEKQAVIFEATGCKDDPIEVTLQLLKEPGREPRFVEFVRDISERKAVEQAKSQFVSTVTHELRTPLTSIKGALGLVDAGLAGELNDKASSLVHMALDNSNRLIRLINDILDFDKIEAGKLDYKMEAMDLSQLVRAAVEANQTYGAKNNVTFKLRGAKKPIPVSGDFDRLMQVLANLMSNAAKFSNPGGDVTVSLTRKGARVRVAVRDRGVGIPRAAQATIFDKFTQADSSDQRAKGGTGLGLNIARKMVKAHGGELAFTSREGKGTTFYFNLDILETPAATGTAATPDDGRKRLLICEDDEDMRAMLTMLVERAGYRADQAETAARAREVLDKGGCDGMVLDLGLPDKDGITLIRELRAEKAHAGLPVVVVSANARKQREKLKNEKGIRVFGWLQKPFDPEQLTKVISKMLAHASPMDPQVWHVDDEHQVRRAIERHIGGSGRTSKADPKRKSA